MVKEKPSTSTVLLKVSPISSKELSLLIPTKSITDPLQALVQAVAPVPVQAAQVPAVLVVVLVAVPLAIGQDPAIVPAVQVLAVLAHTIVLQALQAHIIPQ